MRHLLYFTKEAIRGLLQAKLMTFLSILTIGVSLFLFGAVGLAYLNFQSWFTRASKQLPLIAYVEDDVSEDPAALGALVEEIRGRSDVASVQVVDKQEAWRRFEESYGKEMLEAVSENPFPVALEIMPAVSEEGTGPLVQALEGDAGLLGIAHLKGWLDRLDRMKRYFRNGALGVFLLVMGALVMVVSNTIKLTIYARKELVANMRLVGATDLYIETPFIFEGMLQGFLGGMVAIAVLIVGRLSLAGFAIDWGPMNMLLILPGLGVLFGWLGSINAVRKFLT